jgi:hypothetical protein
MTQKKYQFYISLITLLMCACVLTLVHKTLLLEDKLQYAQLELLKQKTTVSEIEKVLNF